MDKLNNLNAYLAISLCLLLLVSYSCSDDVPLELAKKSSNPNLKTRALVPNVESVSNPYLFTDWENSISLNLNGGGKVDAPWIAVPGNSINIPDNFRFDIKKENAWEMLYHTLTEVDSTEPNYILFYNKKTGILKGFYHSPAYHNNQNFYWVLEASEPSYNLPANTLTQNYIKNKYVTTTNVLNYNSISEIGHLNAGWNAFAFELPYGFGENSNLTASIFGYNEEIAVINLNGRFSGVINIPKEVVDNEGITSVIGKFTKGVSSVLKTYSGVIGFMGDEALASTLGSVSDKGSSVAKFFQTISSLFSKTKIVNMQGTLNGTMKLNGSSVITQSGIAKSINNIPLNKQELGLWRFKEPTLYSSRYFIMKFRNANQCRLVNHSWLSACYVFSYRKISFDSFFYFPANLYLYRV